MSFTPCHSRPIQNFSQGSSDIRIPGVNIGSNWLSFNQMLLCINDAWNLFLILNMIFHWIICPNRSEPDTDMSMEIRIRVLILLLQVWSNVVGNVNVGRGRFRLPNVWNIILHLWQHNPEGVKLWSSTKCRHWPRVTSAAQIISLIFDRSQLAKSRHLEMILNYQSKSKICIELKCINVVCIPKSKLTLRSSSSQIIQE